MRVFIAALLPENIKYEIAHFIEAVDSQVDGVKWEKQEKLHITLKFLGNVETPMLNDINELLADVTKTWSPIDINLLDFGGFPNLRNPRVLVMSLSEDTGLGDLQSKIDNGLSGLGFEKEKREFRSHVTVGRVKKKYRSHGDLPVPDKTPFTINEIAVIKSEITREGSIYTPISTFQLAY